MEDIVHSNLRYDNGGTTTLLYTRLNNRDNLNRSSQIFHRYDLLPANLLQNKNCHYLLNHQAYVSCIQFGSYIGLNVPIFIVDTQTSSQGGIAWKQGVLDFQVFCFRWQWLQVCNLFSLACLHVLDSSGSEEMAINLLYTNDSQWRVFACLQQSSNFNLHI